LIAQHLGDWKSVDEWTALIKANTETQHMNCMSFKRRINCGADRFISETQPLFYEQTNSKYCINRRFIKHHPVSSDAKILEVCFTQPIVDTAKTVTNDIPKKQTMYEYIDSTPVVKRKSSASTDSSTNSKKQRTSEHSETTTSPVSGTLIMPTSIAIDVMTANTMYAPNLALLFPSAEETTDLHNKIRGASMQAAQIALSELDACRLTAVANSKTDFDWMQTPFINKTASIPNMSTASLTRCMNDIFELLQLRKNYRLRYKDDACTILNVSWGHLVNDTEQK
jgi:hypothetical protein